MGNVRCPLIVAHYELDLGFFECAVAFTQKDAFVPVASGIGLFGGVIARLFEGDDVHVPVVVNIAGNKGG